MNKKTILSNKLNNLNLNLHTLSERSGVAYSTVYNIFTGKKSISDARSDTVYRISRVLGVTMDELYRLFAYETHPQPGPFPNFLLMWEDEVVADVKVGEYEIEIRRFDTHPVKQIFFKEKMNLYEFGEILRRRCFEEKRPDLKTLLETLDLDEYNPYKICMKTHGKMLQDKTWFKFEGETLNYNTVRGSRNVS